MLIAAVLAAAALAAPQDTAPQWAPSGAVVAFDRGANVLLVPSGGGRVATFAPGRLAAWEPDSEAIAVLEGDHTRILGREGGEIALLDGELIGWSPDGSRTAWIAADGLYVGDAAAANARRIVALPVTSAAWSRDGTRIAFTSGSGASIVNADGSALRSVYSGAAASVSWSFDSSQVAFESNGSVWIASAAGGPAVAVGAGGQPVWAPLTSHLAYVTANRSLEVAFLPGSTTRVEATAVDPSSAPAWSPDGRYLAYAAARDCLRDGIYVKLYGARTERRLTNHCHLKGTRGRQTLRGTPYRDVIRAGAGPDRIFGLGGNDLIEARNGYRDVIDCGPGRDVAIVDRRDVVHGCETVLRR